MNYSNVPLVYWQYDSLAVLPGEWDSPHISLPNVMHWLLPIVADILRRVLSTVKGAWENILYGFILMLCLVVLPAMNTARHHDATVPYVIRLVTSQMGPVQHPPASYMPTQHHHTCKGRRGHLSRSPRRGLHASTPEGSRCSSTFPVRIVQQKKTSLMLQ